MVGFGNNFSFWNRSESKDLSRVNKVTRSKANFDIFFENPSLSLTRRYDAILRRIKINEKRKRRRLGKDRQVQEKLAYEKDRFKPKYKKTPRAKFNLKRFATKVIILAILLILLIIMIQSAYKV